MKIPLYIHQTWKNEAVPLRWRHLVKSVKKFHPGWTYRLWTDAAMAEHVHSHHPDLFAIYSAFEKNVMRADVFRYVIMHDVGGLYCDLDYEFLRPFPYGDAQLVLAEEFSRKHPDDPPKIANFVFASEPGHPLWRRAIDELIRNPPTITSIDDVVASTGPGFLTRVFLENRYEGVVLHDRVVLCPERRRGKNERELLLASGRTFGMHHAWGSWKERWSYHYLQKKAKRVFRLTGK